MKKSKEATKQNYRVGFLLYSILGIFCLVLGLIMYFLINKVSDLAMFWSIGSLLLVIATWQHIEYRLFDIEEKLGLHEEAS